MWIVGNEKTLTAKDEVWKALFEDAKQRRCILDPGSDSEMIKIIRKVKQELDQLADLLHPNSVLFNGTLWKVHSRPSWIQKWNLSSCCWFILLCSHIRVLLFFGSWFL